MFRLISLETLLHCLSFAKNIREKKKILSPTPKKTFAKPTTNNSKAIVNNIPYKDL